MSSTAVAEQLRDELGDSATTSPSKSTADQQSLLFVTALVTAYLDASAKLHDAGQPNPLFQIARAISEERFPVGRIFFHLMNDMGRY